MTLLWIAFALLLLPAIWLLISPLRRAQRVSSRQQAFEDNDMTAEQNVAIFKRRLSALEASRDAGELDEARFEEDRLELERRLLEDTQGLKCKPLKSSHSGRIMVPLVLLAVVGTAVVWYQFEGAEGDLLLLETQREVRNHPEASLAMYLERMEEQAALQPNNPNVWSELFPLYRQTGQIDRAQMALERLMSIDGRQAPLLAELAQLRFFMEDRQLTPEVQALVDETLEQDPRQPTVLGLLGIHAFDSGNYEVAIDRWRRAIANIQDPDTANSLREGIRTAQRRLGVSPGEIQAQGPAIRVEVSLDERLEGMVSPDAVVFVTARDIAGEMPPLAVAQAQVADLPRQFVLDDTNAMSADVNLSAVREARLMVRVSSSGQATPQPGDLFGTLDNVPVGGTVDETVQVTIDNVFE